MATAADFHSWWTENSGPLSGEIIGEFHPRRPPTNFGSFLVTINTTVLVELDIHLIVDDARTHKTLLIHPWLVRHPRFHVHFTPTSGSWMNLAERWFAAPLRRNNFAAASIAVLRNRRRRSVATSTSRMNAQSVRVG